MNTDGLVLDENDTLTTKAWALFDVDRVYRYRLLRQWDETGPRMTFIMLNPSTADAFVLDPTVRRCVGFAKREGCAALEVVNIFALRSTDPKALRTAADPIGSYNDQAIEAATNEADIVVAAWGAHGVYQDRGKKVRESLARRGVALHYLSLTKAGHPGHPLYIAGDALLTPWGLT